MKKTLVLALLMIFTLGGGITVLAKRPAPPPPGGTLYALTSGNTIYAYDLEMNPLPIAPLAMSDSHWDFVRHPALDYLYISDSQSGDIIVVNTANDQLVREPDILAAEAWKYGRQITFNPAGTKMYAVLSAQPGSPSLVEVIDVSSPESDTFHQILDVIAIPEDSAYSAGTSTDGEKLFVGVRKNVLGQEEGEVHVFDLRCGNEPLGVIGVGGIPYNIYLNYGEAASNGQLYVVSYYHVAAINPITYEVTHIDLPGGQSMRGDFFLDGARLILSHTGGRDYSARVIDTESNTYLYSNTEYALSGDLTRHPHDSSLGYRGYYDTYPYSPKIIQFEVITGGQEHLQTLGTMVPDPAYVSAMIVASP